MCKRELRARRNRFKYCTWPADGHFISKIHFVTYNKLLYQLERAEHSRSDLSLVLPGTSSVVFHSQGSRKVLCRVIFHISVVLIKADTAMFAVTYALRSSAVMQAQPREELWPCIAWLCPTESYVRQENRELCTRGSPHCHALHRERLLCLWLGNVCCSPLLRRPEIVKLRIDAYIRNLSQAPTSSAPKTCVLCSVQGWERSQRLIQVEFRIMW